MSTTVPDGTGAAPLEPLQEAILSRLGDIEGPNANITRRLVYDIAITAYELGWNVAQAKSEEAS